MMPIEEVKVHPLFIVDEDADDDEIRTVTSIHIARKENGKLMYAPRPRPADELTSLEQIQSEFGGGEYILIGYNNGRISARRIVNLPGKSKPLFDDGASEPTPAQTVQNQPSLDPMSMIGPQGGIMGLIMMMMQQMMQQQAQAAQSQTQMFIAMMNSNQQASADEKAQARAELQANIERERLNAERTMALMREMMTANRGGGAGEDFTRGVEFMRSFATQQIEALRATASKDGDGDWSSLLETLGQVMQGVGLFKNASGVANGNLPEGMAEAAEAVAE